jgi:hypothetical protein
LTSRPDSPRALSGGLLPAAFVFAVAAFAWWRFSGNTADNDLWGHVLYGQRMLALGHLEKADPFSWTAPGAPWINHEVLAELTLGWVHRLAGGTGLWLLAMITAIITVALALRTGHNPAREPGLGLVQAALLAASTNGIALGFSARPQLFTLFALVLLLAQMQALDRGRRWPLFTLPLLTVVWINTHGGVLLALLLLLLAAAVTFLCQAFPGFPLRGFFSTPERNSWRRFNTALLLCGGAALVTPWGVHSVLWLFESIQYTRPEITEWRPTPFDPAHAAFWLVALLSLIAWLATRRERRAWAAASLALLLVMAWRHQRHIPLFCLANLVLTPPFKPPACVWPPRYSSWRPAAPPSPPASDPQSSIPGPLRWSATNFPAPPCASSRHIRSRATCSCSSTGASRRCGRSHAIPSPSMAGSIRSIRAP